METSENLDQIAAALAAAQGEMTNAALNRENPHFRSRYADLAAIRDTVVPALSKHGIALSQLLAGDELLTVLVHSSGQRIVSRYPLPRTDKAQAFGSALTYGRRYSLAAIAGISADEDDDGNAAQNAPQSNGARREIPKPPSKEERADGERAKGIADALKAADSLGMLSDIWSHADIDGLPDKFTQRLRAIYYERLDALSPDTDETEGDEPHEAKLMRAG